MKAVKKVFVALSAILVWTAVPAVSANAVSIGQTCAKTTLGTRVSIRVSKKPVIVVCRKVAGRKKWIRAAVQTMVTTTTSTSTTSTTIPEPVINYSDVVDAVDPTLHIITVEGMQPRTYQLIEPTSNNSITPIPLLLAFHSRTGNAQTILTDSQLGSYVDPMNFILIAINGSIQEVSSSWNAGTCCSTSTDYQINDLLLTEKIIDSVKNRYNIDKTRIWAVGHSNGGMMSFHLACDLSEIITGIALVGGALMDDSCSPTKPVSIFQIHGNLDPTIPYNGGGKFNVPDILGSFTTVNSKFNCTKTTDGILPLNNVEQYSWNCPQGTQEKLNNFLENGHEWHLEYTKYILRFLFDHPRS